MTTRQLAEKLDIAPVTVVMYENGKHPIPYDVAIKLSDVLEIESSLLYDDFSSAFNLNSTRINAVVVSTSTSMIKGDNAPKLSSGSSRE